MKLTALKAETYRNWQTLYKVQEAYVQVSTPVQDAVFDEELDDQAKLAIRATKRFLYWLDYGKTLPGS